MAKKQLELTEDEVQLFLRAAYAYISLLMLSRMKGNATEEQELVKDIAALEALTHKVGGDTNALETEKEVGADA